MQRNNFYIVLCGTHSVGKTTTVKAAIPELEKLFGRPIYYIKEIGRKVKAKYGVQINKEGTAETQRLIEEEYKREEEAHNDQALITDRSIIDRFAYTLLGKAVEDEGLVEWYKQNIKIHCAKYSHIFYVPLVDDLKLELDGVRDTDETYRRQIDEVQRETIKAYKLPVYELRGSTAERVAKIKEVILNGKEKEKQEVKVGSST